MKKFWVNPSSLSSNNQQRTLHGEKLTQFQFWQDCNKISTTSGKTTLVGQSKAINHAFLIYDRSDI